MCGVRARCGQKDAYMDNNHLAAYLSDHLAESVMAVDLLTERESIHQDTKRARVVRTDIEADREKGVCGKIRLYRTFLLRGCSRLF